jgi:hypothetical protein
MEMAPTTDAGGGASTGASTLDHARRLLQQSAEERVRPLQHHRLRRLGTAGHRASSLGAPLGRLDVSVRQAEGLSALAPYVELRVGSQSFRTRCDEVAGHRRGWGDGGGGGGGGRFNGWFEDFCFVVHSMQNTGSGHSVAAEMELEVNLWDAGDGDGDTYLGFARISLESVMAHAQESGWYPLATRRGGLELSSCQSLSLLLRYTPEPTAEPTLRFTVVGQQGGGVTAELETATGVAAQGSGSPPGGSSGGGLIDRLRRGAEVEVAEVAMTVDGRWRARLAAGDGGTSGWVSMASASGELLLLPTDVCKQPLREPIRLPNMAPPSHLAQMRGPVSGGSDRQLPPQSQHALQVRRQQVACSHTVSSLAWPVCVRA